MAYDINYEDKRFAEVESEKSAALAENEKLYDGMISESDQYYQAQIDASKEWSDTQQKLQQEQTDFAIEQIEQQKEQTEKDYKREQSGAYVDWQKQSNQYGVNAEQMASSGLANSGYSESSQVSMYNTYQNRVATARESYNKAVLNYNNAIKDARLQNNGVLAEIAYKALQQQLELSLQGFQYKNQLLLDKANKESQINDTYHSRYQDVLAQINKENALQEEIRQFNAQMAEEKRQFDTKIAEEQKKATVVNGAGTNPSGSNASPKVNTSYNKKSSSVDLELFKAGVVDTGITVGMLPGNAATKYDLNKNAKIGVKNGEYFAVQNGSKINLKELTPAIAKVKNATKK